MIGTPDFRAMRRRRLAAHFSVVQGFGTLTNGAHDVHKRWGLHMQATCVLGPSIQRQG